MDAPSSTASSPAMVWIGRIISALIVLFIVTMGILKHGEMEEGLKHFGYPAGTARPLFLVEMACVLLYAIPQTAVLGAILMTGYLGGATATHVRAGEPWFFPILFGVLVWLGLFFRDAHIRALIPFRKP